MNPPSALQGAMGRERKPFTYTPGGLDLSEIKSERMAKRLMRNAMNQGVPEQPQQTLHSPSTPTTPIAVPNFNCLPVQVFPTLNLPANPKSLLRTRSTPDKPKEPPTPRVPPPTQNTNSFKPSGMEQLRETISSNPPSYMPVNNNTYNNNRAVPTYEYSRPSSMYEYSGAPATPSLARTSYGSDAYTVPILPEISYEAEFCRVAPRNSNGVNTTFTTPESTAYIAPDVQNIETITDLTIKPLSDSIFVPAPVEKKPVEDIEGTDDDDQTQVKVVKKQVKKEKKVENETQNQNGDQNGEAEAAMTVKLPTKKSAAKTETKVEVVKKTLPDGSIEETKTTITKTTVDGKTNITTKTETTIIPKAEEEEVEEEEEEEEEEESSDVVVREVEENEKTTVEEPTTVVVKKTVTQEAPAVQKSIVKNEESSETTTTKKVVIVQGKEKEPEEVEDEEVEEEEVEPETTTVVVKKQEIVKQERKEEAAQVIEEKKPVEKEEPKVEEKHSEVEEEEEEEEEEEVVEKEEVKEEKSEVKVEPPKKEPEPEEEEVEEEEDFEEAEEPEEKPEPQPEKPTEPVKETKVEKEAEDESEYTEEEVESEKEEAPKPSPAAAPERKSEPETLKPEPEKVEEKKEEPKEQPAPQPEEKVPLREPSIPLEKVEDVEIKPIGAASETFSKTHSERTEITSGTNLPSGTLSTQTEYNRIENIVTVNRTTKTLDHSYEQITQQGIPTVKTYFAPGRERVSTSPQPSRPYQPIYPSSQPQPERRHSLLLERLSTERQMPSDLYQKNLQQQYSNQTYDQQRQWSQEPQSEVVNDSNVKPSTITNQQWYQQSRKENVIFNNISPSAPAVPSQQWSQPQPQYQPQVQQQPQAHLQPQYQSSYIENSLHDSSKITSNTYQQNNYPSYTPAPSNWASSNVGTVGSTLPNVNTQPNQYSFLNKSSSENYQNTSQQYSSSYVPPPWEQDPNYVAPELPPQNYYQPPPAANTFSPSSKPGWKPTPPTGKFSKPVSKAYIPPAPNQSFVKTASSVPEPSYRPGSKTYYSEYERRYITVPESTYIPSDAKFQAQPDPSPQYYYDNNEPTEAVEHQWRKELREFTEKTQTQTQTQTLTQSQTQSQQQSEQLLSSSVNPPWEEDPKYVKVPTVTYTPTPSWSQTLRPQSNRERSFESEFVGSNEWSKTNTLGRSRPLSTYGNSNVEASIPERPRGVSVDRYNPNKYQSPLTIPYDTEHGPVQSQTLDPNPAAHRGYHNPNVPAYHTRTSAEPREQQASIPIARNWGDSRTTPIQSRSFKYLQWITGTED